MPTRSARRAWASCAIAFCCAGAAPARPCAQWAPITPIGVTPIARFGHRIVYDEARRKVVLFGGYDGANLLSDTWEYDPAANTWEQRFPATVPISRVEYALTYDPFRARTILFSGVNTKVAGQHHVLGLWEWNGIDWERFNPPGPTGRHGHVTAFDTARNRMVLSFSKHGEEDSWEYAPAASGPGAWSLLQSGFPPTRAYNAMAYDASRGVTVAFGGYDASKGAPGFVVYGDTFEWSGAGWQQRFLPVSPQARYAVSCVYDAMHRRISLVAGYTGNMYRNDTWVYDGAAWTQLDAPGLPEREHPGLCFDTHRGRIIVFGGHRSTGPMGDLWELRFDPEFASQPQDEGVREGFPAQFEVTVSSSGAATYQWRHDEVEVPGATSPKLVIQSVSPADAGEYLCVVTAACGVIYSLPATLAVLPPCAGDANGDGVVDFADLNLVLSAFGQGGPGLPGDVNHDGVVNFVDLNIVLGAFGSACPAR